MNLASSRLKLGIIGFPKTSKNWTALSSNEIIEINGFSTLQPIKNKPLDCLKLYDNLDSLIAQSDILYINEQLDPPTYKHNISNLLKKNKHVVITPFIALQIDKIETLYKIADEAGVKTSIINEHYDYSYKNIIEALNFKIFPPANFEIIEYNKSLKIEKQWYNLSVYNTVNELLEIVNEKIKRLHVYVVPIIKDQAHFIQINIIFFSGIIASIKLSNAGPLNVRQLLCHHTKMRFLIDVENKKTEILDFSIPNKAQKILKTQINQPFLNAFEKFGRAIINQKKFNQNSNTKNDYLKIVQEILDKIEKANFGN